MTPLQAVILALVQGITEFLPISSSAHLVIVPHLLGWTSVLQNNQYQVGFDVMLHFGSLLAILIYFRDDILNIIKSLQPGKDKKLLILIIIASIPAFFAGYLLKDFFEGLFSKPVTVSVLLVVTGFILFFAEKFKHKADKKVESMTMLQAFLVGSAQAVAIAPGISRSGSTMSTGIFQGFTRQEAARFSFLMAIPAIGGAALFELIKGKVLFNTPTYLGFVVSLIVSYLVIKFLIDYLKNHSLLIFAYYCWIAGILFIMIFKSGLV